MIDTVEKMRQHVTLIATCMGDWCPPAKAFTLSALVMALRPKIIVEIGVWEGGSLIPLALAAQAIGDCNVIAIDPWNAGASVKDQNDVNAAWWAKAPHEEAYKLFQKRVEQYDLTCVTTLRMTSDDAPLPAYINILHIDGNHADQAVKDVRRYAPLVTTGGIAIMDDLEWHGGHVRVAADLLEKMGFRYLYPLGTGAVYQR